MGPELIDAAGGLVLVGMPTAPPSTWVQAMPPVDRFVPFLSPSYVFTAPVGVGPGPYDGLPITWATSPLPDPFGSGGDWANLFW